MAARTGRLIVLVGAILVSLAASSARAQQTVGVTDDTIRIGTFGALTGPGYLYGKLIMNGAEIVYREANAAGGIHGRKIVYVREDDRCDATSAIAAVKKLIHQHQVFMINGGGCSNPTIAARAEIEKANLPFMVFAAVADEITTPPHPYIFTTALSSSIESYSQLEFALKRGAKRIAILSQRDAWGAARYKPLLEAFQKKSVAPVADLEIAADANDATTQVLRLQQVNADAVLLVVYPKPAAHFLRDAARYELRGLFVGNSSLSDLVALQQQAGMPGALENFYANSVVRYTPTDPEVAEYAKLLEKHFPGDRLSVHNMVGVASGKVVVEVLRRAGRNLTRDRVREVLQNLKDFDTGVYAGKVTCTPTDHQCNKTPAWLRLMSDGSVKVVDVTPVTR